MKIRSVLKEFEAHLQPTQHGGKIQGKSELKHYGDGRYRFKLSVRNISVPDSGRIAVMLDETRIMELTVMNNQAKIDTESDLSIGIPAVKAGQRLQITSGEIVLADGQYFEE